MNVLARACQTVFRYQIVRLLLRLGGGCLFFAIISGARPTQACSFLAPRGFEGDTALDDGTSPPTAPMDLSYEINRGVGGQQSGCSQESTSCDDIGKIEIRLGTAQDDRTPVEAIGYRIELVSGQFPAGKLLPHLAVFAPEGMIVATWADGATDEQEPIDFSITITAIDAAGNTSAPSEILRIHDEGNSPGCRVASASSTQLVWITLGLAVVWFRRRR